MKMCLHPLTVEIKDTEIVLSQDLGEGSAKPIIVAVEQVEQVCDLLYRVRKVIWQRQQSQNGEGKTMEPFIKEDFEAQHEPFAKEGMKGKEWGS